MQMKSKTNPPMVEPNFQMMLSAACSSMGMQAKRDFAARMDLLSPVTFLHRYSDPSRLNSSFVNGQIDSVSTLAMMIRMGDPDLIKGALESPRFKDPSVVVHSREYDCQDLNSVALAECLAMSDIDSLHVLKTVSGKDHFAHELRLAVSNEWSERRLATDFFVKHADSHDPLKVKACARWMMEEHRSFIESMSPDAKSSKSKAQRAMQVESNMAHAKLGLLSSACAAGSMSAAEAAMELGALPDFHHAARAFEAGAVGLAAKLWSAAQSNMDMGHLDAKGPKEYESVHRHSRDQAHPVMAIERRNLALAECALSLSRLARGRVARDEDLSAWESRAMREMSPDIGEACLALLGSSAGLEQRQDLGAPAFALSDLFENPAGWVRRARAALPCPGGGEFVALARAGKWSLAEKRLADALRVGVDEPWRESTRKALVEFAGEQLEARMKAQRENGAHAKADAQVASGLSSVRMACAISMANLGWGDKGSPAYALDNHAMGTKGWVASALAQAEQALMDADAKVVKKSKVKAPRL